MPELAPLVALTFLVAAGCVVGAAGAAALALAARRTRTALRIAAAGVGIASAYATVLLGFSLASRDRELPAGGLKYFCELDCHIAYSVVGLDGPVPDAGLSAAESKGHRTRVRVRVRSWFDPSTIAPFRGTASLTPNPREVWLFDESGLPYAPTPGTDAEPATGSKVEMREKDSFSRPLRPGESFETTLEFSLPAAAKPRRLFLGDPTLPNPWLIGHEQSPAHGRIWFALPR